jgi:S-adenosylhomocysteine hydrolase
MKFNNILPYYCTQKDIFNQLEESVSQFLSGTNITIFAYGQTGAGKTYSIIGNYSSSSPNCSTSLTESDKENIYHLLSSE